MTGPEATAGVIATAGHVDHGKSSLIVRLTGIDPDRWAEEKRRGLTIDLGFAWLTLPSGREVGFVDVPGHERFIRNMLAGVGPVRLVVFVVAADEGWKPQSEEHLQILDLLEVSGAVVALTKRDLVDDATLAARTEQVRARLEGTRLQGAQVVACSSVTGQGIDELVAAIDAMAGAAPVPDTGGRPRQYLDRVFTIRGAGTVVTGTLTGGPLSVGREAEILPSGHRARIRGLQSHKRMIDVARPVARVAVNLAGTPRTDLERGDVLTLPGQWRPTSMFEGWIRTVRSLDHPVTSRGAFKVYAGSAERDARIRLFGVTELRRGERAFVRVRLNRPVVLDFRDPFVLREAGRRETVAGGEVLDTEPPEKPGRDVIERLTARMDADRAGLAARLVADRGFVRRSDILMLTGVPDAGGVALGAWIGDQTAVERAKTALTSAVDAHHREHPLRSGLDVAEARVTLASVEAPLHDVSVADELIAWMVAQGALVRTGTVVRLPEHAATTAGREDADRMIAAVTAGEPQPPTVAELAAAGHGRELLQAVVADGRLVRISADLVITPEFLSQAEQVIRTQAATGGVTVSSFRQALGTSRKYAVPILEHFDATGVTKRQGDVRVLRNP